MIKSCGVGFPQHVSSICACRHPRGVPVARPAALLLLDVAPVRSLTGPRGMRRHSKCSTTSTGWGTRQHSSWAVQASDGIVILDTNFAWATEPEIIEGVTKLGLNPRDIKFVVISHAHGDHDQAAAELQKRFGAKVVMGAADWTSTLQRPATAAGGVPTKDIPVDAEGYKLTLGDTTIDIRSTPGHTPGTLSYIFPVRHEGQRVMVAYSGGTLTGAFGTDAARWDEYIGSQRKMAKAAADAGATVILSNHSEYDNAYTKARLIAAPRQAGENHPFIVGTDAVQRYFTVMAECAARRSCGWARSRAAGRNPRIPPSRAREKLVLLEEAERRGLVAVSGGGQSLRPLT
jgi:metallo-beta-lactamase class B